MKDEKDYVSAGCADVSGAPSAVAPDTDLADHALAFLKQEGVEESTRLELAAMFQVVTTLSSLQYAQRDRILRWLYEVLDMASYHIDEDEDIGPPVFPSIRQAREIMRISLKRDEGFKQGYIANIAMAMHDELHDRGYTPKLKQGDREAIAERVLHLIFSG